MAKTGLLVVTNPSRVAKVLPDVQKHFLKKLYIQYLPSCLSRLLTPSALPVSSPSPAAYSKTVTGMYSQSLGHNNLDVAILLACLKNPAQSVIYTKKPIDVVFFDRVLSGDEMNSFLKSCLANVTVGCTVVSLDNSDGDINTQENTGDDKIYDNVVLGGTFDRLHTGHKILLSEAVLRCRRKLTVGVTDASMLKSKYLSELIEPCEQRMFHVLEFLQDVDPNLDYDVVPISDPFGPTKTDPSFEMIVVSEETLKGGLKVNEVRAQNSLQPLIVHSVNLLVTSNKQEQEEEDKVSSGNLRLRVLGTRLQRPEPRPNLPPSPYIIGLTGGIASGKSSVGRRLEEMGAGLIDCDSLAHTLYQKGEPLQHQIVEYFGQSVVDGDGEINRKVLGSLVFADKDKLTALNNMIWPLLLERTRQEISKLHASGLNIIVMEAAVLRQAGWEKHCHEVWVSIIPPEEAVRRLKDRNNLSEEAAWARVSAQPSNSEQIKGATTVLSTLWSYDFTQRQVSRAWRLLHSYLEQEGLAKGKL